jgi:hypothetical protein
MAWAHHHGADLKILQAALGSAAATLYATEGLQALGYVT